jgi:16S rRNA (cytosine1402-N4)-methyltransferase
MRMDPQAALSAEDVLNTWPEAELARILRDYGEERHWRGLARHLVSQRMLAPLRTTAQLVAAVTTVVGFSGGGGKGKGIHPATRTFQALRIAVNAELAVIEDALPAALDALAPGGRLAVISFHSLEDRIVKNIFREAAGKAPPPDEGPLRGWQAPPLRAAPPALKRVALLTNKPVVADDAEARVNARARSAKLRVVEKL